MSSTNATLDARPPRSRSTAAPLAALLIAAGVVSVVAALRGEAPIFTTGLGDLLHNWISWFRAEKVWGSIFAAAAVVALGAAVALIMNLLRVSRPRAQGSRNPAPQRPRPAAVPAADMIAPAVNDHLHVPTSDGLTVMPQPRPQPVSQAAHAGRMTDEPSQDSATAPLFAAVSDYTDMPASLEPAIFHDNASDSFLSQEKELRATQSHAWHTEDILSERHGLTIGRTDADAAGAKIVPIRPDVVLPAHQDPLEAALLAEPLHSPSPPPQSDMNAVISSARRFIDDAEPAAVPAGSLATVQEEIASDETEQQAAEPAHGAPDDEAEIRQAVQMALSVWPDTTRPIVAEELQVRIAYLYHDPDPQGRTAFQLIASGDLAAAAAGVQAHAERLAQAGQSGKAAELWRVHGALHMGRDDSRALVAYARVSELDPADANIHLYLARRYQMAGDTAKMPAVIERALNVISDPAIRTELLTPYADLQMKAGDAGAAAGALEELTRLHEASVMLQPDDIAARSTHAISLARLAQAREMLGAFDQAGPLYKKAHQAFAELSSRKPDHPGLRAMADNALKDAERFGA